MIRPASAQIRFEKISRAYFIFLFYQNFIGLEKHKTSTSTMTGEAAESSLVATDEFPF